MELDTKQTDRGWVFPAFMPALARSEVHVWRVDLDVAHQICERLADGLSDHERRRAEAFVFEHDRKRFVVAHAAIRSLLSAYAGCSSEHVRFERGPFGKPALPADFPRPRLEFNLTHSGKLALIALTLGRRVGIDVELIDTKKSFGEIAPIIMSARELAAFSALDLARRPAAFTEAWTRKEAFAKACGMGLALGFERIEVRVGPEKRLRLVHTGDDSDEPGAWSLLDLFPADGYAGALAVAGHDWHLKCWVWDFGRAMAWSSP